MKQKVTSIDFVICIIASFVFLLLFLLFNYQQRYLFLYDSVCLLINGIYTLYKNRIIHAENRIIKYSQKKLTYKSIKWLSF